MGRDVSLAVHGDDFTFCGLEEDLNWIKGWMESWFEIKLRGILGPEPGDQKEVTILGRRVVWGEGGFRMRLTRSIGSSYWSFLDFARRASNPSTTD